MTRRLRILIAFAVVLCGMMTQGTACRVGRLNNPPPETFIAKDPGAVEMAIVDGMKALGWIPTKESPGVIVGTLYIRTHMAKVRVEYTASSYKISYVDSSNLNYSRSASGEEKIHDAYNGWILNLTQQINARLQHASVSSGG
jgi:hypothetical protein